MSSVRWRGPSEWPACLSSSTSCPITWASGATRNDLWLDVLAWGRQSPYAEWFDINWDPVEPTLKGKILVPFLSHSYGEALVGGALELRFDAERGAFALWAEGAHRLPLCPTTYGTILANAGASLADLAARFEGLTARDLSLALKGELAALSNQPNVLLEVENAVVGINNESGRLTLARLIERQHWRPARYSVAADDINYRRFFIVADLAAIRIERDDVFDHVHALPFQLIAEGLVDGLRVDHVDGLYDPRAYCLKLRRLAPRPIYLVVEKILAPGELLRADWDVEGTTGYEFSGAVARLLTDPTGEQILTSTYQSYTGLFSSQSRKSLRCTSGRRPSFVTGSAGTDARAQRRRVRTDVSASTARVSKSR